MNEVVIVAGVRTPFAEFGGALKGFGGTDLGALVIEALTQKNLIDSQLIDECIMGMVLPCGYGQNPAKQAAIKAGLPQEVEALTVNKVCGSALKAVMLGCQAIQCGDADVVIAGGMESMTRAPYYLEKARWGHRMGSGEIKDHMINDGLWDVVNDFHMGISNELICEKWNVSRKDQDLFAAESYERALKAISDGKFIEEIVPVSIPQKKGNPLVFDTDECPKPTSFDALQKMRPAFKKDGVGTAGNASIISDGASAVLLMNKSKALELGCEILAEIGAQAASGINLHHVLMAPILAIPKAIEKEGISLSDIDIFEINEAFSGTSVAINRELGLDPQKVNVNGGSVALGHPIGASGARLLVTMLHEMKRQDHNYGLVALCLGGGEAVAMIVKRRK